MVITAAVGLTLLVIMGVGVALWERAKDRRLARDFNERLDKVLESE